MMQTIYKYCLLLALVVIIYSCSGPGANNPGTEYMPDMKHSIAYEANYYDYYYYNTWGTQEEYYSSAQPRKPVSNTIARGDAGIGPADMNRKESMQGLEMNGSVPYPYEDSEEERARATREIIMNPYPISAEGLERGKELYDIFCGICHGPAGGGEGYLVSESNPYAVYPAQPAILTSDTFTNTSNGQLYHAIMYGKNVMGGYADKISYEERWQVIHYIRSLQAANKKLVYNENENTLNTGAIPYSVWAVNNVTANDEEDMEEGMEEDIESHGEGEHSHDHGDGSHDHGDH